MKKYFAYFVVYFTSCIISFAQTTEPEKNEKEVKGRRAHLMFTSIPDKLENPVDVLIGKDIEKVIIGLKNASLPVKIPADGIVRIIRPQVQDDPTKPAYTVIGQVQIADDVSEALVIMMPLPKAENGMLFRSKVVNLATFKGGDHLFLNLTKLSAGVELDKERIEVKPGETKIMSLKNLKKSNSVPITYFYLEPEKNKWREMISSTIAVYDTRREVVVFVWDTEFQRISYSGISFSPEPP